MGPDRHLVCWEISLGRSERLPSPLPAPAHQMWGEGHIASSLCSAAWVRSPSAFPHTGRYTQTHTHFCVELYKNSVYKQIYNLQPVDTYKHKGTKYYYDYVIKTKYWTFFCHLCSSPPSPLLLSTILHRSEATSSFCWSVRLRLGSCSWQAVLSDRLNSLYGTKACWSSSQYSRLHGTWEETHNNLQI